MTFDTGTLPDPDAPEGPAELQHEHACPTCPTVFVCYVMRCRHLTLRTTERCWPCRQAGRYAPDERTPS